jgi:hypothetical protein
MSPSPIVRVSYQHRQRSACFEASVGVKKMPVHGRELPAVGDHAEEVARRTAFM